ncbi:putative secreted protein (Por secretion system target) [Marinoscillum furvescens DSM 4134]|uniref:Putative secreted protein (Por secretion system target) n=2 Tax=Marinoscillum furvescens TaxID=1026 RepID=A0A3D9L1B0_MARFU|nr:putative secreted protein (Por secretion system target) [Marinoscillum furvescens DSM 4134]
MKNLGMFFCSLLVAISTSAQVDPTVSSRTQILYDNLRVITFDDKLLFGQEFANSYDQSGYYSAPDQSDIKDVTGTHPSVLGSDFMYFRKDGGAEYSAHKNGVIEAYQNFGTGALVTFDWHFRGPGFKPGQNYGTPDFYYTDSNGQQQMVTGNRYLAHDIVYDHQWGWYTDDADGDPRLIDGKTPRQWFYDQLAAVKDIMLDLKYWDNGWVQIPIVFRMYHEMNGGWFWWGKDALAFTAQDYITLYQMTVNYFTPLVDNVLFCWSPDMFYTTASYGRKKGADYYPGNAYVDVLGLDAYEIGDSYYNDSTFRSQIRAISDFAYNNNKIAALTETGYRTNVGEIGAQSWADDWASGNFWQDRVIPALYNDPLGRAHKVAWILTWINSPFGPNPYVPNSSSAQWAKDKFNDFKNETNVVFANEMSGAGINLYQSSGSRTGADMANSKLSVIHAEAEQKLIIRQEEARPGALEIFDLRGQRVLQHSFDLPTMELDLSALRTGIYLYQLTTDQQQLSGKIRKE